MFNRLQLFFLPLLLTAIAGGAQAAKCDATGKNLSAAKSAFSQQCRGETRKDCDPLSNGRWQCANFTLGANNSNTPSSVRAGAPSGSNNRCEATERSLSAAKRAFASKCAGITRKDCDPVGGRWTCASFDISSSSNQESAPQTSDRGGAASGRDSDLDGVPNSRDLCSNTHQSERADRRGCGQASQNSFTERNGLVVVEMESTNYGNGWEFKTGAGSTGRGYLEWEGGDNFNRQGVGTITVPIVITNVGTYRFSWRNLVNRGGDPSESNDAWLRIEADNFFGRKLTSRRGESSVGHTVCPKGKLRSNSCRGEEPEGSSGNGYLKVYRSGTPVRQWRWVTGTSDNDRHEVFATFDAPGTYNVKISGRSDGHAIDRFVLHLTEGRSGVNNVSNSSAIRTSNKESARQ